MKIKKLTNIGRSPSITQPLVKINYIILLIISLLIFKLQNGYSNGLTQKINERVISLKLVSVTVPEGLLAFELKSGYMVNYNKSIFNNNRISIDVKDMQAKHVLDRILANTRVGYKFADAQTVLLYKLAEPVKPGKISGKVTDEKGEPLPGANIKVVETGTSAQTGVDGGYLLTLPKGSYTLEISYVSYQTQRVTDIVVTEDHNTPLTISLKPDSKGLKEVIVTASYRRASTEGLLTRQKNAAEMSNGISADQLIRTPDRNLGESLKRISGVSSIDNKFILVRGIGERYNSAMLDGTILPSTEPQTRNFSFDLIPAELVDNVVVSKTVTPDMNASFGGGLVQINTKDIPSQNFASFTAGVYYNDQATGNEFLSHKRGKYDYLAFDDGRRDFLAGLVPTQDASAAFITEQSRKFTNDNFTIYRNTAAPSQNYQFTLGRLIALDTVNHNKFGFTAALSYRNTQSNNAIGNQTRSSWYDFGNNTGNAYGFNTTWGGVLNAGLQLGKNRFSFRNTYTRLFDNTLVRIKGYDDGYANFSVNGSTPYNRILEADDPTFTGLLQNKINGQHQLKKIKIEWNLARVSIDRKEKDLIVANQASVKLGPVYEYFYQPGNVTDPTIDPMSRHNYRNSEKHYSWDLAATVPFNFWKLRNTVKAGYFGIQKRGKFDWQIAPFTRAAATPDSLKYIPVNEMLQPENLGADKYQYRIADWYIDAFEGKSRNHAGFIMFDNRLQEKLRLVWGVRAEYYRYSEIKNGLNDKPATSVFSIKPDPRWQWLPSANLTYTPVSQLNIRTAYSSSIVRPEMIDNSQFFRYSAYFGALYGNSGLYSTRINSWDVKTEWFPGLGQIVSVGGFYKRFNKPTELSVLRPADSDAAYILKSADWAKVYGLEFELRKSLGFIGDLKLLNDLTVYGNLTLQKSEVQSTYSGANPDPNGPQLELLAKQNRSMYGQSPYLYNAGLQYTGEHLGVNLMYNKSGRKTYLVTDRPDFVEYEQPRAQIDAQISYRFMKGRLEIRLNAANLLNQRSLLYRNSNSYGNNPDYVAGSRDISNQVRLKEGFSDKFDDGDQIMFSQTFGRTYSTSLTWHF